MSKFAIKQNLSGDTLIEQYLDQVNTFPFFY
jgi:hypothetical protein